MIIKMATQDSEKLLNDIFDYARSFIFKENPRDPDPSMALSMRPGRAMVGLENLLRKKDVRSSINNDDISEVLASDYAGIVPPIAEYLRKSSNKEFLEFISKIIETYQMFGPFASEDSEPLLSEINSLLEEEPTAPDGVITHQEVTFEETPEENPPSKSETPTSVDISGDQSSGWYVSDGDNFVDSLNFYGPFESKLSAVIFCSLIHKPGFNEESAILKGNELLRVLMASNPKIKDLDQAKNIHSASLVNERIDGRINSAALEYTDGNSELNISTSGEVFDYLVKFVAMSFTDKDLVSLSDFNIWLNGDRLSLFPEYFFKEKGTSSVVSDAPKEFNKLDVIAPPIAEIPIDDKKKEQKSNLKSPEKINSAISSVVSQMNDFNISLTSASDSSLLTQTSILEFLNKIRTEARILSRIDTRFVNESYIDNINSFFKSIIEKDFNIKKELFEFREKNKLVISPEMNYEWEFRERFSIFKKIISDEDIVKSLSKVIGVIAFYKLKEQMTKTSTSIVKSRRQTLPQSEVEQLAYDIIALSAEDLYKVVGLELNKNILNEFINSSGIIEWNTSNFVEKIIKSIKIGRIIRSNADKYFSNEESILSSQEFYTIKCGICNQLTQIPQRYKSILDITSREIEQYSFFRRDGSIIRESELIGTDSINRYSLSAEAASLLSEYIKLSKESLKFSRDASSINREYTWEEVNLMISNPSASGSESTRQIEDNIIGLIIRNDILKNYFDATPSGARGIFPNRSLCAGSLIDLQEDISAAENTKRYLEKQEGFKCKATVASKYDAPTGTIGYQESAYVSFNGNIANKPDMTPYFIPGFRFSRNEARCPCHISPDTELMKIAMERKDFDKLFELVVFPNIPQNMVGDLSSNLKVDSSTIYSPPTNIDGSFADDLSKSGYVVCGKKVSISNFDKDPSSRNYIRKVLSEILNDGGTKELVMVVNLLIDYGVEMNDLKPHVEAVLSSGAVTKSAKRKTLKEIFSQTKISLAQDLSDQSGRTMDKLRSIGLVCEHGHKFTIGQSWDFSKTHSALVLKGRFRGGIVPNKVTFRNVASLIAADPMKAFQIMMTSPSGQTPGLGIFNLNLSKEDLLKGGFKQPSEAKDYEELKYLIENRKLYFQSDDGAFYTISKNVSNGAIINSPWESGSLSRITQNKLTLNMYSGGRDSLTQESEDGVVQSDIADPSFFEDDDNNDKYDDGATPIRNISDDLAFADILFPGIKSTLTDVISSPGPKSQAKSAEFQEKSTSFIEKFTTALRFSRTWGLMAADSQIDFLKRPSYFPEPDPQIKEKIENELKNAFAVIGISEEKNQELINSFFESYNILGLISRSVTQDKFLSLQPIVQYYSGFVRPNIVGLNDKDAKEKIVNAIKSALLERLPVIFGIENMDSNTRSKIDDLSSVLAGYLFSPYQGYDYKRLTENAIVDYSGRAFIFSFSIDFIEKIRAFYSKFFFNQSSALYLGPNYDQNTEAIDLINELLSSVAVDKVTAPKILLMEEDEFSAKIEKLKILLKQMYNPTSTFLSYMRAKNVPISDPRTAKTQSEQNRAKENLFVQSLIVYSRFSQILSIASNAIDYIYNDLSGKPMGAPSVRDGAKVLDLIIEPLIKQRDPENFEENKNRILKSRSMYGEEVSLFSTNAIGYARVNLSIENDKLAPVISNYTELRKFYLSPDGIKKESLISDYPELSEITPNLVLLKRILIKNNKELKPEKEFYLALVPVETSAKDGLTTIKIDIIKYLKDDIFRLNTSQGREFASRYLSDLSGIDYERVVLLDPTKYKKGVLSPLSFDDASREKLTNLSKNFEIKISKINKELYSWPPESNLIFDGKHTDVTKNDSYYQNVLNTSSHDDFMVNLDNFPTSASSATQAVSSSHGVIIPFPGEQSPKYAINTEERSETKTIRDLFSISESQIYIRTESGKRLNISWAFKMLDPQFRSEEGGMLRHKLVQAGIVQKMDYVKSQIQNLYIWFSSTGMPGLKAVCNYNAAPEITFSSPDSLLNVFFSELYPFVNISMGLESGVLKATLKDKNIHSAFADGRLQAAYSISEKEFLSKSSLLVDYYNASQILNSNYLKMRPSLSIAKSINVATRKPTESMAMNLLDPYSLWAIVSNPVMTTRFGGPIDSNHIDDYKEFIISIFGLRDIVSGVIEKTGLNPVSFKEDDLFDLSGFYNRYLKKIGGSPDAPITKFATLFGLKIGESNTAESYINGYPMVGKRNPELGSIVSSSEISELLLDSSSYIEHPWRFEHSLSTITADKISDIKKAIIKNIDSDKIKEIEENVWSEKSEQEPLSLMERMNQELMSKSKLGDRKSIEEKYRKIVKQIVQEKIDAIVSSEMIKNKDISSALERNKALENGEDVVTLEEIWSLSRGSGTIRKDSPFSWSDYRALYMEINHNLRKIIASLNAPEVKKATNLISWRKIAQSATDEQGNMIRSLYHKWWEQYLNIMAKLAS